MLDKPQKLQCKGVLTLGSQIPTVQVVTNIDEIEVEGKEKTYPAALFRARAAVLTTSPFATTAC